MRGGLVLVMAASLFWIGSALAQEPVSRLGGKDFLFQLARWSQDDWVVLSAEDLKTFFGSGRCQCPEAVQVRLSLTTQAAANLGRDEVEATLMVGADCDNPAAATTCTGLASLTLSKGRPQSESTVETERFFRRSNADAVNCGDLGIATSLWAIIRQAGERAVNHPVLRIPRPKTQAPSRPELVEVRPGDMALEAIWKKPSDEALRGYQMLCAPAPTASPEAAYLDCPALTPGLPADAAPCSELVGPTADSARIGKLENAMPYSLYLVAIGPDGTPSPPSQALQGTPDRSKGFSDVYEEQGGSIEGGCSVARGEGSALLAILLLLPLAFRRPRRPRAGPLAVVLLSMGFIGSAAAQELPGISSETIQPAPDLRWKVELRLGPHRPAVDSAFSARPGPFERTFGTGSKLMTTVQVDRRLWQWGGTWALALSLGHYRAEGRAFGPDGQTRAADTTSLRINPVSVSLVYRMDALAARAGVPLIPYARMGLVRGLWRASTEQSDGHRSVAGATDGWQAALGIALLADALDPDAARRLRQAEGIEVAIVAEAVHWALDGFGAGDRLRIGDSTWFAGLMIGF